MFAQVLTLASLAAVVFAAGPEPTTPDTSNVGADCSIEWTPDTTGAWKKMYIELMTGDNLHMKHITTVATVDGTDANNHTFTYPCPNVTPNSAIYFYQFSTPASADLVWTTRWAIADKDGKTVAPENPTQPDNTGKILEVPWGTGALVDPSSAVAAPTDAGSGAAGGAAGGSASASGSGTGSASVSATGSASSGGASTSGGAAGSASHSGTTPSGSSKPPGSASGSPSGSAPSTSPSSGASPAFAASWVAALGAGAAALLAL